MKKIKVNTKMKEKRVLPKVYKHDLSLTVEGIGSRNQKEYCDCDECIELRERRDKIFNKWHHKIKRWYNNH